MALKKSTALMKSAIKIIPGGVDSPVRAFNAVGGKPLFIKSAKGSKIIDEDNNTYIDYVGSWGPMILGHANAKVGSAIKRAVGNSTSFGAPTGLEVELARLTIKAFPSMDMVRFVNSGTEATMSAIRLARGFTGREKIMKFEGCYHGHADSLLVKAGSGAATLGVPDSPGVPNGLAKLTCNAVFNDLSSVERIFKKSPKDIACLIVEGSPGNMGVVPPAKGFFKGLSKLCKKYGALLIMDEVMSGFRMCFGGAQKIEGVTPDITCLGKVIGGGLPVGAFGGKRKIMSMLSPVGPVYQAGTLSGNPLAMVAGIETLKLLQKKGVYEKLMKTALSLETGLRSIIETGGLPFQVQRAGSMLTLFFTKKDRPVMNFDDAAACDLKKFSKYFSRMLSEGVYLPPSQFEALFVGLSHTRIDIERTLEAADKSLKNL